MNPLIHNGGCLCGQVRFAALGPAQNPHSCSCKLCQRHTGALTATWVEFPRERVTWSGTPATFRSSAYSSRAFCPRCGSSLGAIDDEPTVALLLGCFDDNGPETLKPTHHAYQDARPGWCRGSE
ncbi:GFA family protein [Pseudomonas sp. NPDC089530]|uniref:GFA family protein n=1 Tax=Pseudomonas sp. NPDC089530 TaxID=3390651 RepID=UPI003CFF81AC